MEKVYRAEVIDPVSDFHLNHIQDGLIAIGSKGLIEWIGPFEDASAELQNKAVPLEDSQGLLAILPAFCDLHFHWVQDLVSDMPKDHLLEWLDQFVFPEENRFSKQDYARTRSREFFTKLARCGTLSGAIYGSIHEHSVVEAMRELEGDFRVGNVVMTDNSPAFLMQSEENYQETCKKLFKEYGSRLAITPRFALSCGPSSLKWLGEFSQKNQLFVQTHLSETPHEIKETLKFHRSFKGFEDLQSYLEIYDRAGLVHDRTILGHCIHLEEDEIKLLRKRGAGIAHCPTSNAPIESRGLGSGLFNFRTMDEEGIRWALATDIGAGPYLSMLDVMKSFLEQNRSKGTDPGVQRALFRSTVVGNAILGFSRKGRMKPGNQADFIGFSSQGSGDAVQFLEELLERERTEFNELPVTVFSKGNLIYEKS